MGHSQEIRARKLTPRLQRKATEGEVIYQENPAIFRLFRYFVKSFALFYLAVGLFFTSR